MGVMNRVAGSEQTDMRETDTGPREPRAPPEWAIRLGPARGEGMLNPEPWGYISSDVADMDPVTPNILLMGRRDAVLPQVLYDEMSHLMS